ncbi:BspA family leucine-rich repeat surface protein [Lactiplantibacillus paraxiangfangensis]|uniref:BspA family leucine-rich repeat surface protein n=1 Tax=Lactiplantibacillus paraxiangfangensis TaxID=3076224 RepID=UPI0030C6CC00
MSSKNLNQVLKSPKVHYRMYKSGRHWLFAGVTVVTVGGSLLWGTQAHAASTSAATDDQSVDQTIVNGAASADSTVPLKQATKSASSVTGSTATSGKSQSATSMTSQVSQASQASQATSGLSSASQPAESDGKNTSSDSGHVTSQAASSESNSVGQSATSGDQASTASASSDSATSQAKSAVSSQASGVDNQMIDLQSMVSLENKQVDRKFLTNNLMASDVTTGNQLATSRNSLLRDATPDDSTFTWSIDDTGTTLTLNGGTPTESLYNMLDDTQREAIKNIVVAKPVTIVGDVGAKFFFGFYNDETITGLENVNVDQATDLSSMFEQLGNYEGKPIQFSGLADWNVSKVTTFEYMFYHAEITSVDVKNWHVSQVTDMRFMFAGTTELSSLNLSGWQVVGNVLSNMDDFVNDSGISSLDLRSWQLASKNSAAVAFLAGNLTELGLNSSFSVSDYILGFQRPTQYPYDNEWIDEDTQKVYAPSDLETLYQKDKVTTSIYKYHKVTVKSITTKPVTTYPNIAVNPSDFVDTFVDTDGQPQDLVDGQSNHPGVHAQASDFKFTSPVDISQVGDYHVEIVYTNDQGQPITGQATLHVIPSKVTYTVQDQTAIINTDPANMKAEEDYVIAKFSQLVVANDDGQTITAMNGLGIADDVSNEVDAINQLLPGTYPLTFIYTEPTDNVTVPSPVAMFTLINSKEKLTLNSRVIIRPNGSITAADLFQTALDGYGDSLIDADGQLSKAVILNLGGLDLSNPTPGTYQISATYTDDANNVVTTTGSVSVAKTKESITLTKDDHPVDLIAGPKPYFVSTSLVANATDGFGDPIDASQLQYDYYDLNNQPTTLDLTQAGQYQLKISYTDSVGNVVTKTVMVNLKPTKLKVQLKTTSEAIVVGDNSFNPTSLVKSAIDEDGNPLMLTVVNAFARMARLGGNQLLITNHVDVNKAGTYTVDFSTTDIAGNTDNQSVAVTVYVPAKFDIKPTETMVLGEVFDPESLFISGMGVDGSTLTAADLTYDLSRVDFTKAGVYQLPVSYKDQYGKLTTVNSELTIKAQPVVGQAKITLNAVAPIVAAANQTFDPTQVIKAITTATGENVPVTDSAVQITSNVDPTTPGTYQVQVSYDGVSATATITVVAAPDTGDSGNGGTTTPTKPDTGGNGSTTTPTTPDNGGNGNTTAPTEPDNGGNSGTTTPTKPDNGSNGSTTTPTTSDTGSNGNTTTPTTPDNGGNGNTTTPTEPDNGGNGSTTAPTAPDNGDNGSMTMPTTPDTGNGNGVSAPDNNGGTNTPATKPGTATKAPVQSPTSQPQPVAAKKQSTNGQLANLQPAEAAVVAATTHVRAETQPVKPANGKLVKLEKTTGAMQKTDGELPQTDDQGSLLRVVGAVLVGLLSLLGLASRRKF